MRLAVVDVLLADVEEWRAVGLVFDGGVGVVHLRRCDVAVERSAAADAARVEADDVEVVGDVLRSDVGERARRARWPMPPGPPGFTNSVPMRSSGSSAGVPGDGELDRLAVGLVVVERHADAPHSRSPQSGHWTVPSDGVVVVPPSGADVVVDESAAVVGPAGCVPLALQPATTSATAIGSDRVAAGSRRGRVTGRGPRPDRGRTEPAGSSRSSRSASWFEGVGHPVDRVAQVVGRSRRQRGRGAPR